MLLFKEDNASRLLKSFNLNEEDVAALQEKINETYTQHGVLNSHNLQNKDNERILNDFQKLTASKMGRSLFLKRMKNVNQRLFS